MANARTTEVSGETEDEKAQDCELEILESMLPGQVSRINTGKWKVWRPINCHITLRPRDSVFLDGDPQGKYKKSVVLHVKCSNDYPSHSRPTIDIIKPDGISQEEVKHLLESLQKTSKELEGQSTIYQLVELVQDYLTDHGEAPAVASFHDKMVESNQKKETEKHRNRLNTEQKELALLEEEMRQRNAMEVENTLNGTRTEGETKIIGGRRIIVASNIPVTRHKPSPHCHEWMGFYENMQLLISEWTFRHTPPKNSNDAKRREYTRDFTPFLKKLDHVETLIKSLCTEKPTDNFLINYVFVYSEKCIVTDNSILVQFFVAQQVSPSEENLEVAYDMVASKSSRIRILTAQAVCALRAIHEANHVHRHLTMGSVWLNDHGFRFSDYESMTALLDLDKLFNEISTGKWAPKDEEKENKAEARRKDLFQLGTLLDTLVLSIQNRGSNYSRVSTPTQEAQNPENTALAKFIAKCQEAKNAEQLLQEQFLQEEQSTESNIIHTPFGGSLDPSGRTIADYCLIRLLGRGGFGDVILVRNLLDQNDYAIKRIPLPLGSEKQFKRIIKEAKFPSRFNHPNLVRYYNVFIDTLIADSESSDDDNLCAVRIPGKKKKAKVVEVKKAEDVGGGDSLMPANLRRLSVETSNQVVAKEWSTGHLEPKARLRHSRRSPSLKPYSEEEDEINWDSEEEEAPDGAEVVVESSSSDEPITTSSGSTNAKDSEGSDDSVFDRRTHSLPPEETSDDVVFLEPSDRPGAPETPGSPGAPDVPKLLEEIKKEAEELQKLQNPSTAQGTTSEAPRILCIQMEYCDNGTLRQYIDDKHCLNNPNEIWRIFAEVLCGLKCMHEFGVIHRDIKPMNIFLTQQNGVKIGDFGLATLEAINSKGKSTTGAADKSNSIEVVLAAAQANAQAHAQAHAQASEHHTNKGQEVHQTKEIGTTAYMAPELFEKKGQPKVAYTSKVDMYSSGVVLFEMFYRPLPPGMERISMIHNLREELRVPPDFGVGLHPSMCALAKKTVEKLLQENPDNRPTADDLLNDEDLPMHTKEDATFRSLAEKVVKKRDCRMNAWLLDRQFKQDVSTSANYCYDVELCQTRMKNNNREALVETLRAEYTEILKVHAFEKFHTHTLLPVSTALAAASVRTKPVEFLDRSGLPVALPMDLRQNFVRFCVRNTINRMKRYNFGRVYSENGTAGVHPVEKWECCVDSIGPQSSSMSLEAELLLVACEMIAQSLPGMKLTLKIGHAQLLEAQIRNLKLSDDSRLEVLDELHLHSVSDKQYTSKEKLEALTTKIGAKAANIFMKNAIPTEHNLNAFKEKVATFRKNVKVETARALAEKAIRELEDVIKVFKYCRTDELEKINISYDAQTCYRPRTFGDGLVFQIQVETTKQETNKKGKHHTVLAGGRYDSALLRERHPRDRVFGAPQCICGFGIAMDVVVQAREYIDKTTVSTRKNGEHLKVLICSMVQPNESNLIKEKFKLAKQFWSVKIQADVFHMAVDDLDSLIEHCNRARITHILAVCNSNLEVLCKTENAMQATKMDFDTVVATFCRETLSLSQNMPITPNGPTSMATTTSDNHEDHMTPSLAVKSSSTSHVGGPLRQSTATIANLNVIFATSNDKFHNKNNKDKKRVESQVRNHLTEFVQQYAIKTKIEVFVCDISEECIKRLLADLTKTSTPKEIDSAFDQLIQKHGKIDVSLLRKQLHTTLNTLHTGFGTNQVAIIFYRHENNFFRCLT